MTAFEKGDLVVTHVGEAGVITAVYPAEQGMEAMYDVRRPARDVHPFVARELLPVPHRPAPDQVWRLVDDPDITVTVLSVTDGGLYAECVVPSGVVQTMVLVARYELVGEVPA